MCTEKIKEICGIFQGIPLENGRCGGLMVSALISGLSGTGSSPGQGHCAVFLGKILLQCPSPPRCINGYQRT